MGEDILIFRDENGRPGVLAKKCAHRCADLSYGRVEAGGLRCVYHGWVFDVDGRCLETPAEPPSSTIKDRVRQRAYPCHEAADAVWAYFGSGDPPLFPKFPALADSAFCYATRWQGDANWLQASEGNIDPVHTSFLHQIEPKDPEMRKRWGVFSVNARPEVSAVETRFGVRLFTKRRLPDSDDMLLRVTNFVMPNACAVGGFEGNLGNGGLTMLWDVPIDDEHHWRYEFIFHSSGKLDTDDARSAIRVGENPRRLHAAYRGKSLPARPRRHAGPVSPTSASASVFPSTTCSSRSRKASSTINRPSFLAPRMWRSSRHDASSQKPLEQSRKVAIRSASSKRNPTTIFAT